MPAAARLGLTRRRRPVQDHLLEHLEVFQISAAPEGRDLAERLRTSAIVPLGDGHELRLFQHLQMAIQVAVRQRAILLQLAERQTLWVSDERGKQAEAGGLVNTPIADDINKQRCNKK